MLFLIQPGKRLVDGQKTFRADGFDTFSKFGKQLHRRLKFLMLCKALSYKFAALVDVELDGRTVIAMAENLGIVLQVRNRDDVRHVINSLRLYYTRIYRQIQPEIMGLLFYFSA